MTAGVKRGAAPLIGALLVVVTAVFSWLLWPHRNSAPANTVPTREPAASAIAEPAWEATPIAALNASAQTIMNDVRLLQEVFVQWQTNFPATGNPVGTNAEITAVLCGDNALELDLIPRDHPAINARGELCDRWGTPFRFHQRSGTEMQIISAGPDRDFATADDVAVP